MRRALGRQSPFSGALRNTLCLQNTDASRSNKTVSLRLHYNDGASGQRGVVIFSHGGDPRAVCSFPPNGGWPNALARAGFVVIVKLREVLLADSTGLATRGLIPERERARRTS